MTSPLQGCDCLLRANKKSASVRGSGPRETTTCSGVEESRAVGIDADRRSLKTRIIDL